ncbi:MAG: hypothetical protein K2X87_27715 [Gemmataceae bacterium]|nr:hypothetical protein [Gemmataceae bacterium]
MPLIALRFTAHGGLRVRVRVALDRPTVLRLRQAGQAIPQPVDVDALIDPGAERTCVDPAVVARVGLPLYAFNFSSAPGTAQPVVPALGGVGTHTAGVTILHPTGVASQGLVVPELVVRTLPLRSLGLDALIGRDILARCVFGYDGPAGAATLAY